MNDQTLEVLINYRLTEEHINVLKEFSERIRIAHFPEANLEGIPSEVKEKAEVMLTSRAVPDSEEMPNLRWIQYTLAGTGMLMGAPIMQREGFRATSLSGANAPIVAEFCVAALLTAGHQFPLVRDFQKRKEWPKDRWYRFMPQELRGATVGLVGYGSISREVARLLQPFGVEILAIKKDLKSIEDSGFTPTGTGDPEGLLFRRMYPPEARKSMLKLCDFVIVALPLTEETRGMIGKEEFKAMKDCAILVAVGRGGQVDEAALVEALKEKQICAAVLDVFEEEPLPAESPLWEAPNLFITPHIAGSTDRYADLVFELFKENLRRYLSDEELLNVFDEERGY